MFKPTYLAFGTLVALLGASRTLMVVDAGLYGVIAGILGVGDWTYLRLQSAATVEIVKVVAALPGNTLQIVRGIDYTTPAYFLSGTAVDYVDTRAAILDSINLHPLTLTVSGGMELDGDTLSYAELDIDGLGGIEFAGGVLSQQRLAAGCCSLIANTPPPIPIGAIDIRGTGDDDFRVTGDGDYRTSV